ncbi:MAG TPA: Uma2 family endonuclease [Nocardioidaceae bacterium]|nr:Uma2 family endonuclease [Nocardioidaceae bacterium]
MGTVTTLPRGRALTRRDLEAMPDDGHRYELIDGTLIVTPAPSPRHQMVVAELLYLLMTSCPRHFQVLTAPLDVAISDDTVLQPDILVARRADFTERDLPVAPVLAVEVLSPSTRRVDLTLKRARYEAAGCPSYWVVDPGGPALTVWQLRASQYLEVGSVAGEQEYHATAPFGVTVCPARLVG